MGTVAPVLGSCELAPGVTTLPHLAGDRPDAAFQTATKVPLAATNSRRGETAPPQTYATTPLTSAFSGMTTILHSLGNLAAKTDLTVAKSGQERTNAAKSGVGDTWTVDKCGQMRGF